MSTMKDLFKTDSELENDDSVKNVQEHFKDMTNGRIGKLALELAEETVNSMNMDNDVTSVQDMLTNFIKNPSKLIDMVQRMGSKLDEKIAKNNYDDAYSLLQLNLDKSKYDLEETNQLINVAVEKKNTAVKGLEISIRQYELGLGSITERLAAETDYQNSCLEYLQAIYNQRIATLKLMDASASLSIDKIND